MGTSQVSLWSHLMWGEIRGTPRAVGNSTGGNRLLALMLMLGAGWREGGSGARSALDHPCPTRPSPSAPRPGDGQDRLEAAVTVAQHPLAPVLGTVSRPRRPSPRRSAGSERGVDLPCQVDPAQVAEEELQVVGVLLLHQGDNGAAGRQGPLQDGLRGAQPGRVFPDHRPEPARPPHTPRPARPPRHSPVAGRGGQAPAPRLSLARGTGPLGTARGSPGCSRGTRPSRSGPGCSATGPRGQRC